MFRLITTGRKLAKVRTTGSSVWQGLVISRTDDVWKGYGFAWDPIITISCLTSKCISVKICERYRNLYAIWCATCMIGNAGILRCGTIYRTFPCYWYSYITEMSFTVQGYLARNSHTLRRYGYACWSNGLLSFIEFRACISNHIRMKLGDLTSYQYLRLSIYCSQPASYGVSSVLSENNREISRMNIFNNYHNRSLFHRMQRCSLVKKALITVNGIKAK